MFESGANSAIQRAASRALVLVLALAGTVATPLDANAGEPLSSVAGGQSFGDLDPATLAVMRRQEKLNPALTILTEAAMKLPGGGFTSIAFEGDGLTLYWKGALPSSMAYALAAARKIGPVQVRSAAYSKAELEAEAAKIESAAGRPNDIQSIALRGDGAGLTVEKMPSATSAVVQKKTSASLATAEQAISKANVTVPVVVTTATTSMTNQTCAGNVCRRTDDESWWNSGGRVWMKHNSSDANYYGGCTGGFAVTVPAWGGRTALLTAAHCATWHAGQGDWFYDGAGELIGRASVNEDWDKDIMLIDAYGWYWMWDGTSTTTIHKSVHSWGYAASGESVCLSGATSGTRCWLQTQPNFIYSYQVTDSDGDTYNVHGMVRTCRTQGSQPASQNGDSGGPVFTLDGNGVRAKGVHSGGDGTCTLFQDMADVTTDRSGAWVHVLPYTG